MSETGNEAQVVMADAQFTVAGTMRPVTGFEQTYEGQAANSPIYLFPQGDNVDPIAADGIAGYDPELARGLSVPIGSRIILWLPNLFYTDGPNTLGYRYGFIWRLRNVFDFSQGRNPYHLPLDQGVPDTTQPAGQQARTILPAAYNTLTFIQTEPTAEPGRSVNNIHSEDLEASSLFLANPLLPSGSFQPVQQGVLDPAVVGDAEQPGFLVHDIQAMGDELFIALFRDNASIANWAFGTTDIRVSQMLGSATPNVGAYVMTGTAP